MNLLRKFIDLLFPPRCVLCRTFNTSESLCDACFSSFQKLVSPVCPICGGPFPDGIQENHVCEECLKKRPYFDSAAALYLYDGRIMDAIHQFKYGGKSHLARVLGPLLAAFGRERLSDPGGILVMPVPLHPRRLRERGYNQSLLLARHVSSVLRASLDFMSLRRTRDTQVQTGLKKDERRRNVRRAFEVTDRNAVKGKTILLVDDVATTGSTLNECSRVLRKAGCNEIHCLVLARAPKQHGREGSSFHLPQRH
ncbi:MAG: ComF family protein [Desulfobacteraceae bacterium]|nr:MAG: ComF family protein [Desulfobacteraceae bacterium]